MKNMSIMDLFLSELENGNAKRLSFAEMCRKAALDQAELDRQVRKELGLSALTIYECWKYDVPASAIVNSTMPEDV